LASIIERESWLDKEQSGMRAARLDCGKVIPSKLFVL
jgi:hypothetical protein